MSTRPSTIKAAPAKAAVAGHPLHPIVVPYPIAALTGAFFTDLAFLLTEERGWLRASKLLILVGIGTGVLAALLGLIDFTSVERARKRKVGWIHAIGNGVVLALATLNYLVREGEDGAPESSLGLQLSAITSILLVVTGWAGGELSYRHLVGVNPKR